jgi:Fic family protein
MAQDSTKPPGVTSYKQTAFGTIPRDELLKLELKGTKKGLEFIHSLLKSDSNTAITPKLIKELHASAFKWIFPDWAGKFRIIQVTYSGKEAPQFFQIPELINNLCEDLKIRLVNLPKPSVANFIDEAVKLLAWFQYQFVFIHPFQDYNGRLARMLTTLLLLKLKLPPAWISVDNKDDRKMYLQAMQQGDEGNLLPLEELISESLTKEFSKR